jgi:hypothetical protein
LVRVRDEARAKARTADVLSLVKVEHADALSLRPAALPAAVARSRRAAVRVLHRIREACSGAAAGIAAQVG